MREILFRGKRIDNGEWIEGYFVYCKSEYDYEKTAEIIPREADRIYRGEYDLYDVREVDPDTVGQFTGLTDKNGTRIFEGDILRDDWGKIYKVIFTTNSCGFMVECTVAPNEYETGRYRIGDAWCNTIVVIGNIHDNPELLEGDQNETQ